MRVYQIPYDKEDLELIKTKSHSPISRNCFFLIRLEKSGEPPRSVIFSESVKKEHLFEMGYMNFLILSFLIFQYA